VIVRPFVSLWFLGHFLIGQFALLGLVAVTHEAESSDPRLLALLLGCSLALAYATNLYLMMAVASLWNHPALLRACWRSRVAFDVLVTVALTGAYYFLHDPVSP